MSIQQTRGWLFIERAFGLAADRLFAIGMVTPALGWALKHLGLTTVDRALEHHLWEWLSARAPLGHIADLALLSVFGLPILGWAMTLTIYIVVFLRVWGATPGMSAAGLRLQKLDGSRPGVLPILVRHVVSGVSALPLFAGYWWCLIDPKRRTWHDLASGTVVVRVSEAAEQREANLDVQI